MNKRREAREILMQAVFQMEVQKDMSNDLLELLLKSQKISDSQKTYIRTAFETLRRNIETIDELIGKYSTNWTVDRMPKTDLSVLRVAVTEIVYMENIPDAVAINEAIEISKVYCSDDSKKFINAVLGKVAANK